MMSHVMRKNLHRRRFYRLQEAYVLIQMSPTAINLQAPCVQFIGQAFRYSPENAFYVFNQQIYFIF